MNKDKITAIATVAVVAGSTALFLATRYRARKAAEKNQLQTDDVESMIDALDQETTSN